MYLGHWLILRLYRTELVSSVRAQQLLHTHTSFIYVRVSAMMGDIPYLLSFYVMIFTCVRTRKTYVLYIPNDDYDSRCYIIVVNIQFFFFLRVETYFKMQYHMIATHHVCITFSSLLFVDKYVQSSHNILKYVTHTHTHI